LSSWDVHDVLNDAMNDAMSDVFESGRHLSQQKMSGVVNDAMNEKEREAVSRRRLALL
jgi:hypothetical protein